MILSDKSIKARDGLVSPIGEGCLQPNTVDLRLDREFHRMKPPLADELLDIRKGDPKRFYDLNTIPEKGFLILNPGECILASTLEVIRVPLDLCAKVEGKSTNARTFLFVTATGGFIDSGFEGTITLELFNASRYRLPLRYMQRICQIQFSELDQLVEHRYGEVGNHYQHQSGVQTPIGENNG